MLNRFGNRAAPNTVPFDNSTKIKVKISAEMLERTQYELDPFVLPNDTKLSSLLFLQNCLNALTQYCRSWLLNIEEKKPKVMTFQRRAKKYEYIFK